MSEASGPAIEEKPARKAGAWQPFTGAGIARFADTTAWRTFTFLAVFAVATAALGGWALRITWWPVIERAAEAFPETGAALTNRTFVWPEAQPRILADAPHLGIAARPDSAEPPGRIADLQLELTPPMLRVAGVAGFVEIPWPPDVSIPLGRHEAVAAWGAWRRPLLATLVVAGTAALFVQWMILATLYSVPTRIAAWILRRNATLGGCWRMSAAALLAGCTLMGFGIFGYAVRLITWPVLAGVFAGNLLVGWAWLIWGLFERPAAAAKVTQAANPFQHEETDKDAAGEKPAAPKKAKKQNPFESE